MTSAAAARAHRTSTSEAHALPAAAAIRPEWRTLIARPRASRSYARAAHTRILSSEFFMNEIASRTDRTRACSRSPCGVCGGGGQSQRIAATERFLSVSVCVASLVLSGHSSLSCGLNDHYTNAQATRTPSYARRTDTTNIRAREHT